jgi:hypothetical protein
MYNSELVSVIRKMVADNTDDILYLPNLALIACREIERLATELDEARSRNNMGYFKATQAPWK